MTLDDQKTVSLDGGIIAEVVREDVARSAHDEKVAVAGQSAHPLERGVDVGAHHRRDAQHVLGALDVGNVVRFDAL